MAVFVLIAGAWHGGWCWQRVVPLLRCAGHEVYTPTLTGLGERVHLARRDLDIETHVLDVANLLEFEQLTDVVLVGHSYGGVIAGAVASRLPAQVTRTIYIDALLPAAGQSVRQVYEDHGLRAYVDGILAIVEQAGDGWLLPPPPPDSASLRVTDPDDITWIGNRLTPHPVATLMTPLFMGTGSAAHPRTYIACLPHPPDGLIRLVTAALQDDPDWDVRELQASHDPMITHPKALATVLLQIVA